MIWAEYGRCSPSDFKGKAGQEITIRFGEMNYPETIPTEPVAPYTIAMYKEKKGQVYTDNYRSALSTDRYILRGDAAGETYEPRFTFHGFRYVEIHGLERPLPLEAVKGSCWNLSVRGRAVMRHRTSVSTVCLITSFGANGVISCRFRPIVRNGMSVWAGQGMRRYSLVRLLII